MIRKISQAITALVTQKLSFELDLIPLRFEGLPRKKIINWLLTESSVPFKPARPWGLPTILQVEPTSRCNLRCGICPVTTGLGRSVGDMDLPRFQQLIDELGEYLLLIMFWDWGEPFLNPDAYAMIRYARGAGVKVVCSTNGHVFADRDHARQVVDCGLDVLVFSVDGITQETYQRFRRQGNLETVLQGIRNVVEEKRRAQSNTPLVNFRFIVMKHGEREVPHVRAFASSLGVDVLTLRKFHFACGPCSIVMGNLRERPFTEIWNGPAYRDFRRHSPNREGLLSLKDRCNCANCCLWRDNVRVHRTFRWFAPLKAVGNP